MASMDEAILKRVLPHSMEAEQSVIGSMIMDREAGGFLQQVLWCIVRFHGGTQ